MFCQECGKEIVDTSVYCLFCGKKILRIDTHTSVNPTPKPDAGKPVSPKPPENQRAGNPIKQEPHKEEDVKIVVEPHILRQDEKLHGYKLLHGVGMFGFVTNIIAIVVIFIAVVALQQTVEALPYVDVNRVTDGVISGLAGVIISIVLIRFANDNKRAKFLLVLSIIWLCYNAYSLLADPNPYFIFRILLPILCIIGAKRNITGKIHRIITEDIGLKPLPVQEAVNRIIQNQEYSHKEKIRLLNSLGVDAEIVKIAKSPNPTRIDTDLEASKKAFIDSLPTQEEWEAQNNDANQSSVKNRHAIPQAAKNRYTVLIRIGIVAIVILTEVITGLLSYDIGYTDGRNWDEMVIQNSTPPKPVATPASTKPTKFEVDISVVEINNEIGNDLSYKNEYNGTRISPGEILTIQESFPKFTTTIIEDNEWPDAASGTVTVRIANAEYGGTYQGSVSITVYESEGNQYSRGKSGTWEVTYTLKPVK